MKFDDFLVDPVPRVPPKYEFIRFMRLLGIIDDWEWVRLHKLLLDEDLRNLIVE